MLSQPPKSVSSPLPSPVRPTPQAMQKKTPPQPVQTARAPANTRPSAKQSVKSAVVRDDLNDCRFCGRRFAADRLGVHEEICGRTAKKKRKAYDATKHRVAGTELEPYVRRGGIKAVSGKSVASNRVSCIIRH